MDYDNPSCGQWNDAANDQIMMTTLAKWPWAQRLQKRIQQLKLLALKSESPLEEYWSLQKKTLMFMRQKWFAKKYYFFKKLSVSTVFSGWQICIWLTSIAIQIFKYTANFAMEASWTFYSLPLWGSQILRALFFWLIIVNRNMDKGVFTNAGKVCGQLFLWLGLFLWLKLSFGKQV